MRWDGAEIELLKEKCMSSFSDSRARRFSFSITIFITCTTYYISDMAWKTSRIKIN